MTGLKKKVASCASEQAQAQATSFKRSTMMNAVTVLTTSRAQNLSGSPIVRDPS
jgi:uncharacterized protein YecT (DUF1311 family)